MTGAVLARASEDLVAEDKERSMPSRTTDSPASLYGPVSLVLGIVSVVTAAFSGVAGVAIPMLAGCLAVTFGVLGLVARVHRIQCAIGLAGGAFSLLALTYLMALVSMSM